MISFDNTAYAFAYKTSQELKQARFLFRTMGHSFLLQTGLSLMPFAIKYKLPFTRSIIRATIFKQFVGGETLEQTAPVADKLGKYGVKCILDYGAEGGDANDEGYDHTTQKFIDVIDYASTQVHIPYMSVKLTGIVRYSLLEKLDAIMHTTQGSLIQRYHSALESISTQEAAEWERVYQRMDKICKRAKEKNIAVMVDAEETWIQDPVDALTMLMMDAYNKSKVLIYNTIQLYRHDRLAFLKACQKAATEKGFILAVKLVRGAYMEKERERAAEKKYPSPIQPDKVACDKDYNEAVAFCMEHIDNTAMIVASHNEQSNLYATQLMNEKGIAHNHPHVQFSQLYGMSDNISFNLAKDGFSASKYLPFGPIEEVVPYLMRRAQENSSVAGQTGRELSLIAKELQRRKQAGE